MLQVGEDQLPVLLLVVQPQLDEGQQLVREASVGQRLQPLHPRFG
jgi:hypothetical protein